MEDFILLIRNIHKYYYKGCNIREISLPINYSYLKVVKLLVVKTFPDYSYLRKLSDIEVNELIIL